MIYVFKTFENNTKHDGITDSKLCTAANEIMQGQYEGNLGGGVYKKRIPLEAGKSGGARAVVAFKQGNNLFFVNGYAKKNVGNSGKEINEKAEKAYKKLASDLFKLDEKTIKAYLKANVMREVNCDG